MTGNPLPKDALKFHLDPSIRSAYRVCLTNEQNRSDIVGVIHARVLGYLLLHLPTEPSHADIARAIISCKDPKALDALGKFYLDFYVTSFKKFKGKTPITSEHSSRLSCDKATNAQLMADIEKAPQNHQKAKENALFRDGFRCVATGSFDFASTAIGAVGRSDYEAAKAVDEVQHRKWTECAHILPECMFTGVVALNKRHYVASVLAVLERYGYSITSPNGDLFHSLFNVMTVVHDIREPFDRLELWFEATTTPHKYVICVHDQDVYHGNKDVTFTTPDEDLLPLPSPELLALHAACCKVAHMSGAVEYVEQFWRDFESMEVLAEDGGSADLFKDALHAVSIGT